MISTSTTALPTWETRWYGDSPAAIYEYMNETDRLSEAANIRYQARLEYGLQHIKAVTNRKLRSMFDIFQNKRMQRNPPDPEYNIDGLWMVLKSLH